MYASDIMFRSAILDRLPEGGKWLKLMHYVGGVRGRHCWGIFLQLSRA